MLIYSFLMLLGVIMVLPMVYAVSSAFKPLNEMWIFPPRFFVQNPTGDNFSSLFGALGESYVPFTRYLFNTVCISVIGTAGHVVISSLCAYPLAKHRFIGSKVIFHMIVMSLMFTSVATGLANYLILSKLGWIDSYLAILIPGFGGSLGLYLMKQFMESNVPDSILESARIDGAAEWRIFWRIVMPIVKPAWLTLIIFSFNGFWSMGGNAYIYNENLKTLNYAISQIVSGGLARAGAGAAASVLMMIPPILIFVITQSNIVETMASSGMKE
ncbi:MAG: carbohydrate ABC transporter permease [Oscillospiraceae bacterium]|jgi:ABC-type glycerol-3-phosphate transport system permease component|nr:carbohydrate ABC transporter permease [Oscillospiraceae bacterium]